MSDNIKTSSAPNKSSNNKTSDNNKDKYINKGVNEEASQEGNEEENEDIGTNGNGGGFIEKKSRQVRAAKEALIETGKLAESIATGNIIQAIKSAIKLLKNEIVDKIRKREFRKACLKLLCIVLSIVLCASTYLSIINSVVDKIIELAQNLGKSIRTFWKWITDDYWIKLDDDIEYTTIDNTRSGSYEKGKTSRRIYKAIIGFRNFIAFIKIIRRF